MSKKIVIHPVLFAIYPILSLFEHNKDMAQFSYLIWPLILALGLAVAVFSLVEITVKNKVKSGILTSLFLILFFSFGHLSPLLIDIPFGLFTLKSEIVLVFMVTALWLSLLFLLKAAKKSFLAANTFLTFTSLALVFIPAASIVYFNITTEPIDVSPGQAEARAAANALDAENYHNFPDIYYIILDGYARQDVLKELYGHDNGGFIDFLENKGFYVASKSNSNYAQTYQSISSALNLRYLDGLAKKVGKDSSSRKPLKEYIRDNEVYRILDDYGYKFVAFPSTWAGYYNNLKTDIYLHKKMDLNEFDYLLIKTTPLNLIFRKKYQLEWCREKLFFTFDLMPEVARLEAPTFVYAHFLIPHPPFLFDEKGGHLIPKGDVIGNDGSQYFRGEPSAQELAEYRKKYKGQLKFLNGQVKRMIGRILGNSKTDPIIIIQSDHGPGSGTNWNNPGKTDMFERFSILNAYYLPETARADLYDSITPINSFRVIFNHLFGAGYELLPDKSYFSTWDKPYKFIDISQRAVRDH